MMQIAMTVSNNAIDDVRVIKEANALVDLGHEVYIFGNDMEKSILNIGSIKVINCTYPYLKRMVTKYNSKNKIKDANIIRENQKNRKGLIQLIRFKLIEILKGIVIILIIESTQRRMFKMLKECGIKFEFIHCHDLDTLNIGVKYKQLNKCKLVYDSHELWTEMSGINKYVKKRYSLKEEKYLYSVDYLITVSPSIICELKSRYKINIPTILLRNIPSYETIKQARIPDNREVKLLYIGYFINGRGIEDIIDQAVYFPRNIELTLIVQNNQDIIKELNRRINEKDLIERVKISTFVPQNEVINEISKYDIGLLPYLPISLNNLYCLPNKLFQYLSAGVCIVANNLPDVKSIIDKYECGVTYECSETLVNVIKELSSDTQKIYQYKKNSLKAIELELNWESEKDSLISIYEECIKNEE